MYREKLYKSIVREVEKDILDGKYKLGDRIPSINSWRIKSGLSRSSVLLAMNELISRGLIESEQSVGYFVSSTRVEITHRFLLIFNEFNSFKQDLYRSILNSLGNGAVTDIVFYNFNRETFDLLLQNMAGKYSVYLVMGGVFKNIEPQLRKLGGVVIVVDSCDDSVKGAFSSVTQDFARDTHDALEAGLSRLKRYNEIVLVQSSPKEPMERYDGLQSFCQEYDFTCALIKTMKDMPLRQGVVYLTPEDREIVNIMRAAEKQHMKVGEDFGLVAFNEQELNEILCNGLTTISTDFVQMGKAVVDLVKEREIKTIRNPWRLILRNSL